MSGTLISSEIAEPYAQALMSLAQQSNLTEEFGNSCRDIESLMEESSDFKDFIVNPVANPEAKKEVLRQVFGDANPYFINFLMLLVDKRRIVFLKEIAASYSSLLRKLNQVVLAEEVSQKP